MSRYDPVICKTLREKFNAAWKRVEPYAHRRALTKDKNKINTYKTDLCSTFNEINQYYSKLFLNESPETQEILREFYTSNFKKIYKGFQILHMKYEFKNTYFEVIDPNLITAIEPEEQIEDDTSSTEGASGGEETDDQAVNPDKEYNSNEQTENSTENLQPQSTASGSNETDENLRNFSNENNLSQSNLSINLHDFEENPTMPQSKTDFMRLAGPILNYKYDGDALKLETFLTDVELVEEMAEPEQKALCFKFIKSKLEGRALEAMPEKYETIADIVKALKEKIKPDSSKVVAGKISSLRLIKGNYSAFAKQAEELAECLRRSLINEGMTKVKAEEIAIEETQKLCRKTTNNDIVKSAMALPIYKSPAEVIAKFITESDTARLEYKQKQNNHQNKQNQGKKFDKSGKKGNAPNNQQNNQNNKNGGKKTFYNSNYGGNKQKFQGQRTEAIRVIQGNHQSPPEGGASSSNAQGIVYQLTPQHQ